MIEFTHDDLLSWPEYQAQVEAEGILKYCDTCCEFAPREEVEEIIDPIYGRSHGFQCQSCSERHAEERLSGDD